MLSWIWRRDDSGSTTSSSQPVIQPTASDSQQINPYTTSPSSSSPCSSSDAFGDGGFAQSVEERETKHSDSDEFDPLLPQTDSHSDSQDVPNNDQQQDRLFDNSNYINILNSNKHRNRDSSNSWSWVATSLSLPSPFAFSSSNKYKYQSVPSSSPSNSRLPLQSDDTSSTSHANRGARSSVSFDFINQNQNTTTPNLSINTSNLKRRFRPISASTSFLSKRNKTYDDPTNNDLFESRNGLRDWYESFLDCM